MRCLHRICYPLLIGDNKVLLQRLIEIDLKMGIVSYYGHKKRKASLITFNYGPRATIVATILLGAFLWQPALGDSHVEYLDRCKTEAYERLQRQTGLLTALAIRISGNTPAECLREYKVRQRFLSIESDQYFKEPLPDQTYREQLNQSSNETDPMWVSDGTNIGLSDYRILDPSFASSEDDISSDKSSLPSLDTVRGHTSVSGVK